MAQKGEWKPKEENSFAPALCNRIDRNTGGIVIAAKNAEALRILNEKYATGRSRSSISAPYPAGRAPLPGGLRTICSRTRRRTRYL